MSSGELDNLSSRAANTTPNVEDLHAGLDTDVMSEVVFVSSDGAIECLAVGKAAEMKTLRPSVLVEVCGKVVVPNLLISTQLILVQVDSLSCQACVVVGSLLSDSFDLILGFLVVPELKVLVNSSGVSFVILVHHGTHSTS